MTSVEINLAVAILCILSAFVGPGIVASMILVYILMVNL